MMFKRLGRFAVLAVCLFAIAIVMGGCNRDDPPPPPPIELPTETPGQKLTGQYELVETVGDSGVTRPPDITGDLFLFDLLGTYTMSITIAGETRSVVNGSWGADDTHITLDGTRLRYSWDGTYLTYSNPDGSSLSLKWRKI